MSDDGHRAGIGLVMAIALAIGIGLAVVIAFALLSSAALAPKANAQTVPAFFNSPLAQTRQPAAAYRLAASGTDLRVYEWRPSEGPDVLCMGVFSNAGGGHVRCLTSPPVPQ